jgi:phosphatidylinositol-3-phosphatase
MTSPRIVHTIILGALTGAACSCGGSDGAGGAGGVAAESTGTAVASASASAKGVGASFTPKTVFTILLENQDYDDVVASPDAPYLNGLIARYGLATNYMDSGTHPSLPNYLYMISGDTQYTTLGFIEYDPTFWPFPVGSDNLGHQLTVANVPWRSYQESMGGACTTESDGLYACRHDPFLYFDDIQNDPKGLCAETNVDYSQFSADLAAGTYRYMWITPNLLNDGHDPSEDPVQGLKQADHWLSTEVPKILASDVFQRGGVLFITWDEAEGRHGNSEDRIPMIVVTPGIKAPGYKSDKAYSHASYLATVEEIFGLPRLGDAAKAATMEELWR